MGLFSSNKNYFLVLDIGTESIKSLAVYISSCYNIIGRGIGYFDGNDFPKALKDSMASLRKSIGTCSADKRIKNPALRIGRWNAIISFSASISDAKVESVLITRKNPKIPISSSEERKIKEDAILKAKESISKGFEIKKGILDSYCLGAEILEMKLDGYQAMELKGLKGKEAEALVFLNLMPKEYFKKISALLKKSKISILKSSHICQGIPKALAKDGYYIDIGGDKTQILGFKDNIPILSVEINSGGHDFSERISETFGIKSDMAGLIIDRYCDNLLSHDAYQRIKSIFQTPKNNWYNNIMAEIKKNISGIAIPKSIYLMGGASALPEIQNSFFEKSEEMNGPGCLKVSKVTLSDFKNVKDFTGAIDSPKWITPLLLSQTYGK